MGQGQGPETRKGSLTPIFGQCSGKRRTQGTKLGCEHAPNRRCSGKAPFPFGQQPVNHRFFGDSGHRRDTIWNCGAAPGNID